MNPPDAHASYREPLEPPPTVDSLDEALAREIYETRNAERLQKEALEREQRAKERQERSERRRRIEIEKSEPHPYLVVRQTRGERVSELLTLGSFAVLFLIIPTMPFAFGWLGGSPALNIAGVATAVAAAVGGFWFFRKVWPHAICDSLRLRVTPMHYEIMSNGHRSVGERAELELDVSDDRITIKAGGRYRFNELHIEDVNTAVAFFRAQKLKVS